MDVRLRSGGDTKAPEVAYKGCVADSADEAVDRAGREASGECSRRCGTKHGGGCEKQAMAVRSVYERIQQSTSS